ncbi:MAG: hypothetical protein HYS17_07970 [Micavibrio aeruginosavorus]|uniref:Uncharacterized protein n=1 Tax=Micavibrio aeruginosavorus TaxID=349221 RepID=A0A7T5R0Y2_9BACT|nr:MAG: hypothetical protein HYS17_07970 [Micavibrio aeruginosavorus]
MVAPSPNERKSDNSLTATIVYFIIGAFFGVYFAGKFFPFNTSPIIFGLTVLTGALLGIVVRKGVFEFFR